MKKVIVYFGIIQYDTENAMCQRAEGIKRLIIASGYIPKIIAVNKDVARNKWRKRNDEVYEINAPSTFLEWLQSCISARDIKGILQDIGINNIKTVIMADYRFKPMKDIAKFCEKHKINYTVDIMDWFVSNETLNSKIKKFDNDLRMKKFYPKVKRRIYICSSYNNVLGITKNTRVIPGVTFDEVKKSVPKKNDKVVIFFAGNPGKYCEKERIDWIINAFKNKKISDRFLFYIAGVEKKEFIENNYPGEDINENIIFLGRIAHEKCISMLRRSDFSMIIREDNHLSKFGFSTKIGEALANGIPVIVTNTSDNRRYIQNGINGYIIGCSEKAVKNILLDLSTINAKTIDQLKESTFFNNPLSYRNYLVDFKQVI